MFTNVAQAEGTHGPMGHLIKLREYPNAPFRDVTAPNADTLYTTAFLDVGKEPWVVGIPDMDDDRYALFPMLDGWTKVFEVPGKRTTGTGAQTYAITGPGWEGTLPDGVTEYKSPTSMVWLLGRIYCTGTPEDYAAVHALQDQFKLMPLSAWGTDWTPPAGTVDPAIDMKTAVRDQVNAMDAVEYFTLFCRADEDQPAGRGRRADDGEARRHRHRARPGLRREQAQRRLRQAHPAARLRPDHAALQVQRRRHEEHQRLGLHHQDRPLRHRLPAARADHRHRPRRQPPAGRGLSDVHEAPGGLLGRDYMGRRNTC